MALAEELPEPIFTPTTKADEGHDVALTRDDAIALVGQDRYEELRDLSIAIYRYGTTVASTRGILLADTKLEFGDGRRAARCSSTRSSTPDSSRFWPADEYEPGTSPPSFDKQFVRQYLLDEGWDGTPPPAAAGQGGRGHPVPLHRGLRAADREELRRLVRGGRLNVYEVRIDVVHRPGILDPQGGAIERALPALGSAT